jgi:hypothetical protein
VSSWWGGGWPTSLVCGPITGGQRDAEDVTDGIVAGIWSKQSGRPTRADQTCGAELHQLARHKARVAASGLLSRGGKNARKLSRWAGWINNGSFLAALVWSLDCT